MQYMALALNGLFRWTIIVRIQQTLLQFTFSVIIWHFFPSNAYFLQTNYVAASSNQIHSVPSSLKHKCKSEFTLVFFADSVSRLFVSELLTFPFWQPTIFQSALRKTVKSQQVLEQPFQHSLTDSLGSPQMHKQWWGSFLSYKMLWNTNYIWKIHCMYFGFCINVCMFTFFLWDQADKNVSKQAKVRRGSDITRPHRCFEHRWLVNMQCCWFPYLICILFLP